jgi:hypothetical protein
MLPSLENREYGRGYPLLWPRDTHYLQKFSLTSPTNGRRSVGIVRSRAKAMELSYTMLQAGMSWVRDPMRWMNFFKFI